MSSKKKFIFLFVAILIVVNVSVIAFYLLILAPEPEIVEKQAEPLVESKPTISALSDEYFSIHFNFNDAVELCLAETRSRNNNLIYLVVNKHSSRYKENEDMYLIKLDSQIGTPLLYDEKSHLCEIDPKTQGVAFYREITLRSAVRPL